MPRIRFHTENLEKHIILLRAMLSPINSFDDFTETFLKKKVWLFTQQDVLFTVYTPEICKNAFFFTNISQ